MNKLRLLLVAVFLVSSSLCPAQKVTTSYIEKYLPLAKELSTQWGIPVAVILGVSILESGSGTSINCRQLNNFFGVKGKNHLRKRKTKYKQYISARASFEDFCRILSTKKYYAKLKGNTNYNLWLTAMNHHNYAGAKDVWGPRIRSLIKKHRLMKYDQPDAVSQ
ncbi:glucosaminidase domain-containing protein [Ferruginibacter albus]|uniref:glucosaminidase domain-containing protein n=1 Tax=Ferruginibacter albus TaxID=2875540 RepID=UPI001CC59E96|nr:glucosaminidase domain-containing protein [Ferruginibacter albus]UAY52423.1 glucosaminidase domain-containing protein [Ferruginibacter albus]